MTQVIEEIKSMSQILEKQQESISYMGAMKRTIATLEADIKLFKAGPPQTTPHELSLINPKENSAATRKSPRTSSTTARSTSRS